MTQKRWPFLESPGDFATRLEAAYFAFDSDMLAAVRNCLIENPPMLASAPAPASGGVDAVAVKALRWVDQGKVPAEAWGESVLRQFIGHHDLGRYAGSYCIQEREPGGAWGWWCTWTSNREPEGIEPTEEAAKAACQADFDRRIRSALSPAATPVSEAGGEAVGEIVMFEGVGKEVSWRKGKMPPAGTKLYPSADDLDHFHAARAAYFAAGGQRNDPQRDQKISDIQAAIRNGKDGALAKPASSPAGDVREALASLLDHVDRETCTHEETHRGGFIWTICDQCGRKWADDQGGFVPYTDPPAVARARFICEGVASQSTSAGRVGE